MSNIQISKSEIEAYQQKIADLESRVVELSDFIENASIPLHWVDSNGIIIWANQAELDALGFNSAEYIGQPITAFHADEEVIHDILARLTANETLHNYPARLKTKDGSIRHVLISSNVLWRDGKFVHTRCFTKDITELKKEEQLKNDFVAMVSHELKTPLTTITSFVQILKKRALKQEDDFVIKVLTRTESQAIKMANMINDFLNHARYQEGKFLIKQESFGLGGLIREVADDAKLISKNHVIIAENLADILVFADRDKIGQVLSNLIGNAIKYSPEPGNIIIRCEAGSDQVRISVTDQGIGISEADQERLFERFFRAADDQASAVKGFGIGLYLVAEILRFHHSEIKVSSTLGQGSTFYFNLDLYQKSGVNQ
jgi:PAS domain S-box-containing protein